MSGSAADASALLRVAQMEEADRQTVQAGTPGIELMQNAGAAVAGEIARRWPPRPTVVLCGPGNNGGDGFVVARLLAAAGWPVRLALSGSMEALRGDARHHAMLWQRPVEPLELGVLDEAALVVDALFGSGLRRPLGGEIPRILEAAARRHLPIVAVDVPSGLLGDTGESLGAVAAVLTVTFTRKKPGHVLLPGRELCGETVVADIGTSAALLERLPVETWENDPALWRGDLPQLRASGNKYSRGHALLWGGYPTTGAARMAARAAARAGAGLTTIAVPLEALPIYAAALTSIMVRAARARLRILTSSSQISASMHCSSDRARASMRQPGRACSRCSRHGARCCSTRMPSAHSHRIAGTSSARSAVRACSRRTMGNSLACSMHPGTSSPALAPRRAPAAR